MISFLENHRKITEKSIVSLDGASVTVTLPFGLCPVAGETVPHSIHCLSLSCAQAVVKHVCQNCPPVVRNPSPSMEAGEMEGELGGDAAVAVGAKNCGGVCGGDRRWDIGLLNGGGRC